LVWAYPRAGRRRAVDIFGSAEPDGGSESRRSQYDCGTDQAGGGNEESTQTGDEAIGSEEMGGPLPRTIEDQEWLLDKNGLGDHRTDAARTPESRKRSEDMNEKDDEIAHLSILARTAKPRNYAVN
jgi:hypothetical protein